MNRYVYILPIVALGCGYRILADHHRKRQIINRLDGRSQLTEEEFGIQYFAGKQVEIASQVRRLLAPYLPLPLAGLHPSDSFIGDLQLTAFRRTAMIEFVMDLEEYFDIELGHEQVESIHTVADMVTAISQLYRGHNKDATHH